MPPARWPKPHPAGSRLRPGALEKVGADLLRAALEDGFGQVAVELRVHVVDRSLEHLHRAGPLADKRLAQDRAKDVRLLLQVHGARRDAGLPGPDSDRLSDRLAESAQER